MDAEQTRVWECFIPVVMPFHINQIKPSPSLAAFFFVSFHYPSWPSHTETTVSVQSDSVQSQKPSTSTFWFMDLIQAKYICALYIFIASEIDESVCMCHCNLRENVKMLNICQRGKKNKTKKLEELKSLDPDQWPHPSWVHKSVGRAIWGSYHHPAGGCKGCNVHNDAAGIQIQTCSALVYSLYLTSELRRHDFTMTGGKGEFLYRSEKKAVWFWISSCCFFGFFLFQRPSKSMSRVFKRLHEVKLNLHDVLS